MKNVNTYIFLLFLLSFWACSDSGSPLTCLEGLDCNNECGGNAIIDECGVCDGSGLNDDGCCNDQTDCIKYFSQIQPIFDQHCINCHGNSGGVNLTSYENIKNSSSIIPFEYQNSILWKEINSGSMPQGADKLEQKLIDLIETWIIEGAQNN